MVTIVAMTAANQVQINDKFPVCASIIHFKKIISHATIEYLQRGCKKIIRHSIVEG